MKKQLFIFTLIICGLTASCQEKNILIKPGEIWPDSEGNHINVHGGGILYHSGVYYWIGESRILKNEKDRSKYGVGCYSSKDLVNWKNEGLVLQVINDTSSLLQPGCLIERPKVLYNKKTRKFVMWFHHELKGQGYKAALTGVAVSDKITGPYKYLRSLRPNAGFWPVNFPEENKNTDVKQEDLLKKGEEWRASVKKGLLVKRDFEGGQMARDMTLFVDSDGSAWHIHSSEENMTLHFSELTDDYLDFTGKYYRVLPGNSNEAPALLQKDNKYYLFSSGTTGWKPNPGRVAVADKIYGEYSPLGNPCKGTEEEKNTTFRSQSTFILKIEGKKDLAIFMADRWLPENLSDSRHIWLPIEYDNGIPVLKWKSEWSLKDIN